MLILPGSEYTKNKSKNRRMGIDFDTVFTGIYQEEKEKEIKK
jgi:hypothetical protein